MQSKEGMIMSWICGVCGYEAEDERPEICPVCGAEADKFEEKK
jgi:rubrerythrin